MAGRAGRRLLCGGGSFRLSSGLAGRSRRRCCRCCCCCCRCTGRSVTAPASSAASGRPGGSGERREGPGLLSTARARGSGCSPGPSGAGAPEPRCPRGLGPSGRLPSSQTRGGCACTPRRRQRCTPETPRREQPRPGFCCSQEEDGLISSAPSKAGPALQQGNNDLMNAAGRKQREKRSVGSSGCEQEALSTKPHVHAHTHEHTTCVCTCTPISLQPPWSLHHPSPSARALSLLCVTLPHAPQPCPSPRWLQPQRLPVGPLAALGSQEDVFTHDGSSGEKLKRNQSHLC
ncbi:MAP7 domain-containing protein 1-like [Apus apus]|uniref:MAP7 domain-containing protein 1-like n=1 Tax=Apus apus TaxID=8895 RepID=UPI0021F85EDB|nr:MAP7 domain-containing protein 1-like [Apus apus]